MPQAPIGKILQTKLRRPPLGSGLLERLRLLALLDLAVARTLTLVVAPAGSGKTSLVNQWIEQCPLPVAWLQLDASDSDPSLFFLYVVHALRQIYPQFGVETELLVQSAPMPPLPVVANTLSNEFEQLAPNAACLLVLDDYHLVHNTEIDRALANLVQRPPHGLHLLVMSRHTPAWALGKLRLQNRLLEIGSADLRFNQAETEQFLRLNEETPIPDDLVGRLQKQTEGWAAGLQLAVLALRQIHDAQAVVGLYNGFVGSDNQYLLDYLVDEVLGHLPDDLLDFMHAISICARFNAPLCQELVAVDDDQVKRYLRFLEETNLFVVPLGTGSPDDEGQGQGERDTWFRYHHLMQQALASRLQASAASEEIAVLHRQAATWLGTHGYVDEALEHLRKTGDWDAAGQLITSQLDTLLNAEDRRTIERWLSAMPKEQVSSRAGLTLMQAWVGHFDFDVAGTAQALNRLDQLTGGHGGGGSKLNWQPPFDGHVVLLRGTIDWLSNRIDAAVEAMQQAIATLPSSSLFARNSAYFYLATAMQMAGRADEGEAILLHAYNSERASPTQASARLRASQKS